MKIEDVSSKNLVLKRALDDLPGYSREEDLLWTSLVSEVRDNSELENFLRFLIRHLSGRSNRVE